MNNSLARELATPGIRVNAITPGFILTDEGRGGVENPKWFPALQDMTAMRRGGEAEDVAAAALFPCSDVASYGTGEVMVVDGGYTAR